MDQASIEARHAIQHGRSRWSKTLGICGRYGLAIFSVSVALGGALLLGIFQFRDVELPLFLFAVAVTAWYGGAGAAVLALLLSGLIFDYFFIEPLYTLNISPSDIPYYLVFASFASLITWFSTVRRRFEKELRQARNDLEIEVAERTQQASLLNLTHDTIFVRDMSDTITYWNRGAQELYGWTAEEAIGQGAHELLQTAFPSPVEEIRAELLRTGRWDGELQTTRADGSRVIVASRWSANTCTGSGAGVVVGGAGRCGKTSRVGLPPFWKPAMTSPSASGDSRKFKSSTKNSESGLPSSKPLTMNWRPSLTPYRMIFGRHFAIWPDSRSSCKKVRPQPLTRKINGTSR